MAQWMQIFRGGMVFDVAAMFYLNILFIFLMLIPLPFRWRISGIYQRLIRWVFFIFNGIGILLNCIDFVYYRFTLRRTTFSVLREFSHEVNKASLATSFLRDYWYIAFLYAGFILLLIWMYQKVRIKPQRQISAFKYYGFATMLFLLSIPLAVGGIRGDLRHSTRPITISNASQYVEKPHEAYLVLNTPFCFIRTFGDVGLQELHYFPDEELARIYTPVHFPKVPAAGSFDKKNVIIIVLESFSKEVMGFYNHDLDGGTYTGYTPFLDSLASVSKVYWQSFANGRKSIDALPAIISSIPGAAEPFVLTPYATDSIRSLGHILADEGYHNSFFHGAPNGSMGFLAFMKMMGIDQYFGKNEYNNDADYDGIWGIWDEPFLQFFAKKLNEFPQPFFSTFFSVSSHHPFKVPEKYKGRFKKGPIPVLETIGYTDMALRDFFGTIAKAPWFQNTLFVILADHSTTAFHPEYMTEWGEAAIPILLYSSGDSSLRGVDSSIIQQLDIMPTVLGYLNYQQPFLAFGNNVMEENNANSFAVGYSGMYRWTQGDYMLFFDGEKSTRLVDYKNDRLMKNNLLKQQPEMAAAMERRLKAFIQQYNNRLKNNRLTANAK